jgi:hypothetical protein
VTVSVDHPSVRTEQAARPGVLTALSNEMVRLFEEQFGRGPTSARTTWAGDVITVVLEDTLTPADVDGLSVETFVLHPLEATDARSRIEFAARED